MRNIYSNMIQKGVTLCAFFLAIGGASAQNSQWNLVHGSQKVDIYEQPNVVCHVSEANIDMMYTLLQMRNKTASPVQVSFKMAIFYDGNCVTCANSEYDFSFTIPAGQSLTSDCGFDTQEKAMLSVFQKNLSQPNHSTYTRYELQNLVIQ